MKWHASFCSPAFAPVAKNGRRGNGEGGERCDLPAPRSLPGMLRVDGTAFRAGGLEVAFLFDTSKKKRFHFPWCQLEGKCRAGRCLLVSRGGACPPGRRELPAEWGPEATGAGSARSPPREKSRLRQGPDHQSSHKIHKMNVHGWRVTLLGSKLPCLAVGNEYQNKSTFTLLIDIG